MDRRPNGEGMVALHTDLIGIPYAVAIVWLSPRIGTNKALSVSVLIFTVLAVALVYTNRITGVVHIPLALSNTRIFNYCPRFKLFGCHYLIAK